ncbi:acyl-CoA carboxylase subunit epsilon [Streptomyces durbertensis]|uniref:Acyl-CoA carboxylase subunit epsilon n=1 Tax=Streptomyces durbertensis TaxID=2448886 RepID=A0ABR6EGG2_9ACTN|nr:acyl-CoA carboxylase epsilon subunit [Streptomyces durbertensis]MBB1244050.1 acyl-CoA carboxylase subunit epsilon [Streptomyces durbertensis]
MTPRTPAANLLRVEKGHAEPEELAALTAVLLARAAARTDAPTSRHARPKAAWQRLERALAFRTPHSWQH